MDSDGFSAISRGSLNFQFKIPIVAAPSRGGDFSLALTYNSLIWLNSQGAWVPVSGGNGNPTYGWLSDDQPTGFISFRVSSALCDTGVPPAKFLNEYHDFKYTDGNGTVHPFDLDFVYQTNQCELPTLPKKGSATDKSGYFLDATTNSNFILLDPNGNKVAGTRTDSNGNYVSKVVVNSSETDWVDTMGRTTVKMVTSGSTKTYQVLDQNGSYTANQYAVTYQSFPIKNNFQCTSPAVADYTGTFSLPISISTPTGQYSFTYEDTAGISGYKTGRMKRVTLPTGGYYEYQYPSTGTKGVNCADGTNTDLTVVKSADGVTTSTWHYVRAPQSTNWITTVTPPPMPWDGGASNESVYTFNSNGQLTNQKGYQGSSTGGTLLRNATTTWASNGTPASTTTVLEDGQTQTKVETDYDNYGNLTAQREFAWGTGAPGGLVRNTVNSYWHTTHSAYVTANIVNRISQVLVKDGSGGVKARTDVTYDERTPSCVTGASQHNDTGYGCTFNTRGNATTVTTYTDAATPSGAIATHYFYDTLGNVNKTDVGGVQQKQLNFTSTTQYAFPDSIVSGPAGTQTTASFQYTFNTGLVANSTDENGAVTSYGYDAATRRTTSVTRPGLPATNYSYDDSAKTSTVKVPVQGTDAIKEVTSFDGLGRKIRASISDDAGSTGTMSATDYAYDPFDRSYKQSLPYTSSASYWIETRFDALGRLTVQILPDGNTNNVSYTKSTSTTTDSAGHARKQDRDALGRLVTIWEPDPANGNQLTVQTSYTYNVLDEILTTSEGSQTRSFVYDGLGRMTSATHSESTAATQYQYNGFNQITQRTDPRGVITTYAYDGLNRPYQTSYNVGSTGVAATPTVTLTYGTNQAQHNNGRLLTASTSGVETDTYSYDALGQVTSIQKSIGGVNYTIGYAYNYAGEVSSVTYPSGRTVSQTYDGIGRISSIFDSQRTYANAFQFNSAGQVTGFAAGNGIVASLGYSANRLQLGSISYAKNNNTLFALNYGYVPQGASVNNGQILEIDDVTSGIVNQPSSVKFTYDGMGRLTRAQTLNLTASNTWDLSWTYDRYGNRPTQTLNGGTLSVSQPNLTISATTNQIGGGYVFDASGNMTNDTLHSYVYDGENRPVVVDTSAAAYAYDPSSWRVKKTVGAGTTVYIFSGASVIAEYALGATSASPSVEYVLNGSDRLASIQGSTVTYRQYDHLSARLFTDASGNVIGTRGHVPFGETWYSTGTTDKWNFTSYERDNETGSDYGLFRYHNSRLGRFTTTDPYDGSVNANSPQSWNRYAYVLSDPVNSTDQLGLDNDCGGPCVPFWSIDAVGCRIHINYSDYTDENGAVWNMPFVDDVDCSSGGTGAQRLFGVGLFGRNGGRTGSGSKGLLAKMGSKICSAIPDGRTMGVSGGLGGVSGQTGSLELVLNYNTGEVSGFASGGMQVGWNGGVQGSVLTGFIRGMGSSNVNYSGGFTGIQGGNGIGGFRAVSSGGLTSGPNGVLPDGKVSATGVTLGWNLIPGPTATASVTNYSRPLSMGKYWAFTPVDAVLSAAKHICQ